jgi:hypothetical protein
MVRLVVAAALGVVAVACSDGGEIDGRPSDAQPEQVAWPEGLQALVVRDYPEYRSRTTFLRLTSSKSDEVTVARALISSPRFEDVVWSRESTFTDLTELEFELPPGGCGGPPTVEVTITFSIADGPLQIAHTRAEDRSDLVANTLQHDCAQATLQQAADLRVGRPRVEGTGRNSVAILPVVLEPTGSHPEVTFRGFGTTVLFRHVAGSTSFDAGARIRLQGSPKPASLRLEPGRCDMHALIEGSRGTYIPAFVEAPALPPYAFFYLPLDDDQRGALTSFFASHCGIGQ